MALVLGFAFPLSGQEPVRITNPPVTGTPGPSGWRVDPGRGNLSVSIPVGTVPGELPIPVGFSMNGTFLSYFAGLLPIPGNVVSLWQDFGVHGTVGFGYVGWGRLNQGAGNRVAVLEDGRTYAETEFKAYTGGSPYAAHGAALLAAYGVTCTPASSRISADGRLLWATVPAASFQAPFAVPRPEGFGAVTVFHCLADPERLRIFAEVPQVCPTYLPANKLFKDTETAALGLPVCWSDRFSHRVSFAWTRSTTGLPDGLAALDRVEATNAHGQGVTVRYATWKDDTAVHDLLRADFHRGEGPSVLIRGYSGPAVEQPVGYANPYRPRAGERAKAMHLAGLVGRPTSLALGEATTLDQPTWSSCGAPAAALPAIQPVATGCATQVWSLGYDDHRAALTSLTTPGLVTTTFTNDTRYTLNEGPGTYPALLWGVTRVAEAEAPRQGYARHTLTWRRTLPVWNNGWVQPNWAVTAQDEWTDLGGSQQPDRTTTYTYVPPTTSLLDYRNMVLQSTTVTDGTLAATTANVTTTQNDKGGGLDGSLSLPRTVTTSRSGECPRQLDYTYTDASGLQVQSVTTTVSGAPVQTERFTYDDRWPMLAGHQLTRATTERYVGGQVQAPPATTVKVWDPGNLLQLQRSYQEGGPSQHGQAFTYLPDGKVATQAVWHVEQGNPLPSPAITSLQYDPGTGQPSLWTTTYQDPDAGQATLVKAAGGFDGAGRPSVLTDGNQVQTTRAYDLFGRVTRSATQGTESSTTTYPDPWTIVTTQGGRTTTEMLDGFGRVQYENGPAGSRIFHLYDNHGRQILLAKTGWSSVNADATSQTLYDILDRPVEAKDFAGTKVLYAYAAAEGGCNQVTRSFDGQFPTTTLTDPFGQVIQSTAANGAVTRNAYDGRGNLVNSTVTSAADGSRQSRSFTWDALGRLTSRTEPETGTQVFAAFNALNQATQVQEMGGRTRNLTLDGLGRTRLRTASANGLTGTERYVYAGTLLTDTGRNPTGAPADVVTQHFAYDSPALGARLHAETTTQAGLTSTLGYAYASLGQVASLTYPDGRVVTYGFDATGRPTSVTSSLDGSLQTVVPPPPYTPFNGMGNRESLVFASGAKDTMRLDRTCARPRTTMVLPRTGTPFAWSYQYHPATGWLTETGEWTFQQDPLGRLVQAAQNWTLVPDPQGAASSAANLLTTAFTHDAYGNNLSAVSQGPGVPPPALNNFTLAGPLLDNRLPATASFPAGALLNATYTPNGELQSVATSVGSPRSLDLAWDPLGRLAAVTQSPAGPTESYRYTADGLRVARLDNRDPGQTRFYTYTSKGQLLTEYLANGAWARDLIYLDDRAIAELDVNGLHELHNDHLGTPRLITNGTTGAVEGGQTFGPYGEALGAWGYTPATGFTGHVQTEPNGLIYMQGRYYLPQYHRFASPDNGGDQLLQDPQSWNLYSFVRNNPTMLTDPTGMGAVPWYLGGSSFSVDQALQMLHEFNVSGNPGYQIVAQATDLMSSAINTVGNKDWGMLSNLGQAAAGGAGTGRLLLSQSMETTTAIMAGELGGSLLGMAGNHLANYVTTPCTTLFRAVDNVELASIQGSGGQLWPSPGGGLGKYFAFSPEGAAIEARALSGSTGETYTTIKLTMPNSSIWENNLFFDATNFGPIHSVMIDNAQLGMANRIQSLPFNLVPK